MGSHHSQIATLVERHTRYVMLVKVPSKDTKTVIDALIKHAHKLPRELYRSLTWDRGKEMGEHRRFTLATDIQVYFCDPQHPCNVARTRTPTACYASTSPKAPAYRATRRLNLTPWPGS